MKTSCRFHWIFPLLLLSSGCDGSQAELARVERLERQIEETKNARADLEKKIAEAIDLEAWVLASMPLQSLVVAIISSMGPESSIVHLQLEREAETPSQLRMRLVLNTASNEQLEQTLEVIRKMNCRESGQTYTRSNGQLVYTAILLRQDPPSRNRQTPEQKQNPFVTEPLISRSKTKGVDVGSEKARAEEKELQIQLGIEQEQLIGLQQQSADLLEFVGFWAPHFLLVDEQQATEARIRMMVREQALQALSQRYEQVPNKVADKDIASLPTLTRATLVFDDNYSKLLNWLGAMEKTKPTMRVGKIDLTKGSRGGDLRMELTLEVPLLRRGS